MRALIVWGQWLRHWCRTRDPRALRTALICEQIAAEKLAVWHGELKLHRSALQATRPSVLRGRSCPCIRLPDYALPSVTERLVAGQGFCVVS